MLAVPHRPRMASSRQPDLPFGYSVNSNQEPFLDPPDPAPGAPLLSDNDTKFLTSFFADITADQYNMPSFGEGLNFSEAWLDLPPTFMGTSTSLGQQQPPPLDRLPRHNIVGDPLTSILTLTDEHIQEQQQQQQQQQLEHVPHPTQLTLGQPSAIPVSVMGHHHSADVLAAATLLQNGAVGRPTDMGHGIPPYSSSPDVPRSLGNGNGSYYSHQPPEYRHEPQRSMPASRMDDQDATNAFSDMFFGSPETTLSQTPRPRTDDHAASIMQWGSDSSFNRGASFVPTSAKETYEAMEKAKDKVMQCFEVSSSAANTRPPSPKDSDSSSPTQHSRKSSDAVVKVDINDGPPRKRRKSRINKNDTGDDTEDAAEPTSAKSAGRRRKSKGSGTLPSAEVVPVPDLAAVGKRRKSAVNGVKPSRENLSEEQKRENHIKSEQKRRTLIKEGFDDVCDLVPGLKGGGFSKSTMLGMAAEWLEELLKGNDELTSQLASIERGL